jgi:hypothetical protein
MKDSYGFKGLLISEEGQNVQLQEWARSNNAAQMNTLRDATQDVALKRSQSVTSALASRYEFWESL